MRPLRLTMSGFGPYAGKVDLSMEKLGEEGLYLITGDTGAGKTTIFDGITYALFGEASGSSREATMFRSKYADMDTPTFVELEFSYGGRTYLVRRNPEYFRPAKRGDGLTKELADATLTLPDGRIITKIKEVNLYLKDILGVDRNQFSQIAMIAQGDFLKLLLAETKERQQIFREIFKTGSYQVLQERLKASSQELRGLCEKGQNSLNQYIQGIICTEDDLQRTELEEAKAGRLALAQTLQLGQELLARDQQRMDQASQREQEKKEQLGQVNGMLGRGQELMRAKETLGRLQREETTEKEQLALWEQTKKAEEGKSPSMEELERQLTLLDQELLEHQASEEGLRDWSGRWSGHQTNIEKVRQQEKVFLQRKGQLQQWTEEAKTYAQVPANILKIQAERTRIQGLLQEYSQFSSELQRLQAAQMDFGRAQKIYMEAYALQSRALETYQRGNQQFLDAQAGILAKHLQEGEPCPVCGSTTHPHLRSIAKEAPTQRELEKLQEAWQQAQKEVEACSRVAGQAKGNLENQKELVEKKYQQLFSGKTMAWSDREQIDLSHISEEVAERSRGLLQEDQTQAQLLQAQEVQEKRRQELEQKLPQMETWISREEASVSAAKEAANKLDSQLKEERRQLDQRKKDLKHGSMQEAREARNSLFTLRNQRKVALEQATTNVQETKTKLAALAATMAQLEKQLSHGEAVDVTALETKKAVLEEALSHLEKEKQEIHARLVSNQNALTHMAKQSEELTELEKRWTWVKALSDTANGNITGKEKIMLETYIQMTYFDRILLRANRRLQVMSNGQYTLVRRQEAEGLRSQSGLELDVVDHYNGTTRSVKTLSGGESFQASLCLALGLSDEVQSMAGGIQLETMFVDEGFGSLDEEALQQAIRALADLGDSHRLVGIISHVGELKEKIDRQIVVTKEQNGGSKAVIVV